MPNSVDFTHHFLQFVTSKHYDHYDYLREKQAANVVTIGAGR